MKRFNHPLLGVFLMLTAAVAAAPDTNGDGKTDMEDVRLLGRMALGLDNADPSKDMDGDGKITTRDVEKLLAIIKGTDATGGGTGGTATLPTDGMVPVQRFLTDYETNGKFGQDHRYQVGADVAKLEAEGYRLVDPEVFRISPHPAAGMTPLFEYHSATRKDYLYTIHRDDPAVRHGCRYVGILGYVYPLKTPGTVPLYRLWSEPYGDTFYTTAIAEGDTAEKAKAYVNLGVECYVFARSGSPTEPPHGPPAVATEKPDQGLDIAAWRQVTDPQRRYTIKIPADWIAAKAIFPGNTVQSFRPKDAEAPQLSVLKYPVPMPLNQQALEGTIQLSLGIRGVFGKLLSKKACKVGVAEALLNEFSGEFTGHPTHTVQLVTSETTNLYYVAISCEAANPGQLAIARAIAESFRFE